MGRDSCSSPAKQLPPQSSDSRQDLWFPTVPAHAAGAASLGERTGFPQCR